MGRVRISSDNLPVPLKELPEYIKRIMDKKVSELTPEDLWALREWMLLHRSRRSIAVDIRFGSRRVPVYVSTWIEHEGRRYDIPGVDTPSALPYLEELGYHPRHKKKRARNGAGGSPRETTAVETEEKSLEQILVEQGEQLCREHPEECEKLQAMYNVIVEAESPYPKWRELFARLEEKYDGNIVAKIYGLLKAVASDYGLTMNSRAMKSTDYELSLIENYDRKEPEKALSDLTSALYNVMEYMHINRIKNALSSRKTELQRLKDIAVKMVLMHYSLDELEPVLPQVVDTVRKGLLKIIEHPEILDKLFEEACSNYGEYCTISRVSTAVMPEDILHRASQYHDLISLAYLLGKGIDVSSISSIRREAYRVAKEFINEYKDILGEETVKTLARLMRSTKYPLTNTIPALAEALLLLEPEIKSFVEKLGWHGKNELEENMYYQSMYTDKIQPYGIVSLVHTLGKLLIVKKYIDKLVNEPEFLAKQLEKHGIPLRMDGLELRVGKGKIDVFYNGERLGEIRLEPDKLYEAYIVKDFTPSQLIYSNIVVPLETILREKELYLYGTGNKLYLVRYTDKGAEILYPEHELVPYSDLRRFAYAVNNKDAWMDFKRYAYRYGYKEYPQHVFYPEAEKLVMENPELGISIYSTVHGDYIAEYSKGYIRSEGRGKTPAEALLSLASEFIREGKPMRAKQVLEYAEKVSRETNDTEAFSQVRRAEQIVELMRMLNTELQPLNETGSEYINSSRTILVSHGMSKEIEGIIKNTGLEPVSPRELKIYVEAEKPYHLNKELAEKYGVRVEKESLLIPLEKYSRALLKRLGIQYPEYGSRIIVEYKGKKHIYPENIYKALRKAELIYVSGKEESLPLVFKIDNNYVAVAPIVSPI